MRSVTCEVADEPAYEATPDDSTAGILDSVEEVVVRSAHAGDVERLIWLLEQGALEGQKESASDPNTYLAALSDIQATDGNDLLVAESDGEVVGLCQLIVFRHLQRCGGLCAEIESLHVHPDSRGKGIGGHLLNKAVELARQAGCYRVQLTSNIARSDAHRFYERHGFVASHVGFKRLIGD